MTTSIASSADSPAPPPAVTTVGTTSTATDSDLSGLSTRLQKEIRGLRNKPPPGISAWLEQGSRSRLRARQPSLSLSHSSADTDESSPMWE